MSKHVKKFTEKHLKQNEDVAFSGTGYIGEMMGTGENKQYHGVLIVTNQRVCFYRSGILGEVLETMPIKNITSIERKSVLVSHTLKLHTSNDSLAFKSNDKKIDNGLHDAIESMRDTLVNTVQQTTQENPMDTLKKLSELKDLNIITNDEFEIKKAEIMKKI